LLYKTAGLTPELATLVKRQRCALTDRALSIKPISFRIFLSPITVANVSHFMAETLDDVGRPNS
jgi:hypothetical protein